MRIAGVDFSMNCPGVCIFDTEKELKHENFIFYFNKKSPTKKEMKMWEGRTKDNIFAHAQREWHDNTIRYYMLADWMTSIMCEHRISLVAMEDYALGAKGRGFNIAESTGIFKQMLMLMNIRLEIYSPSMVKKSFTGKGNADKTLMVSTYNERYGVEFHKIFGIDKMDGNPVSDMVDAHAMAWTFLHNNTEKI